MSTSTPRSSSSSADLSASGPAKLEEVTRLLEKLSSDLEKVSLLPHQRDAHLEALKIFGRDPAYADPIFTKQGIETLARHAFNSPSNTTSRNALRCLANALLLKPDTRQMLVDLDYEAKACNKLKNDNRDDEFLVSRIIFLTTYGTNIDIEKLIDQYHIADNICQNISRHSKQYITKTKKVKEIDPMEDMSLIESLKLLFNLAHHCPQRNKSFAPALQPVFIILNKRPISANKPLDAPIGPLIHAPLCLDLEDPQNVSTLFPKSDHTTNAARLIELLDMSVKAYTGDEFEREVPPLLTLVRKAYEVAPKDAQLFMQTSMLPSEEDRKQVLGRAPTLSGRLLKLLTNPVAPSVRESVSSLLFELSDKDATRFVQNIGYGFASGFLMNHNMPVPENAMEAFSSEGTSKDNQNPMINPITGQRLDSEAKVEMPEMTDEEKEREAERLFVLFERLKKTGVMNVQNPVESALQEGRFTELDDDADSE